MTARRRLIAATGLMPVAMAWTAALLSSLAQPATTADAPGADSEVRRTDRAQSRITLRHGGVRAPTQP